MMKRNKAILCALVGIGFMTSAGTVSANAMTIKTTTTTSSTQAKLSVYDVEDLIYDIPYYVDLNDKDNKADFVQKLDKAEDAYNKLDQFGKDDVDRYTSKRLKVCKDKLQKFESDLAKSEDLIKRIERLKTEVGYNKNEQDVTKTEVNTNKLKTQKDEIKNIRKTYDELDYSFRYESSKFVTNYDDFFTIECRLVGLGL